MNKKNEISHKESGSAILWILVAVGLFAALNFAFNSSSRTSTSVITGAQAEAYANQIIQHGNELKLAIKRMQLQGVKENEINFYNEVYSSKSGAKITYINPNTTNETQKVFSKNGGGITPFIAPTEAIHDAGTATQVKIGHSYFRSVEVIGTISSANDIVWVLPWIKPEVCKKINNKLGIESIWPWPIEDNAGWSANDIHSFSGTGIIGDEDTRIISFKAFCTRQADQAGGHQPFSYKAILLNR